MSSVAVTLSIAIADDHPVVIEGLRNQVSSFNAIIVGCTTNAASIMELVASSKPDVLVMESRLGNKDALRTIESFSSLSERPPIVVFSSHTDSTHIARASALGVHDYILKSAPISTLMEAIGRAARGESTPEESLLKRGRTRMRNNSGGPNAELTNREMQVLRHVSMGLSNREVGKSLGISVETVKEHVQNILRKLSVNDRTQAAVWAVRNQLV
jgi:DNA-binding NarL/FixJ family response regulator